VKHEKHADYFPINHLVLNWFDCHMDLFDFSVFIISFNHCIFIKAWDIKIHITCCLPRILRHYLLKLIFNIINWCGQCYPFLMSICVEYWDISQREVLYHLLIPTKTIIFIFEVKISFSHSPALYIHCIIIVNDSLVVGLSILSVTVANKHIWILIYFP
jgi:hypothetical protein